MKAIHSLLSSISLIFLVSGCAEEKKETIERAGKPDYIKDFSEDRMRLAMKEAQSTLEVFLKALKDPPPKTSGYSIRKGFTFGDSPENIEFVWIGNVRRVGEDLEGQISNSPVDATHLAKGQVVRVTQDEVADWMYVEDGELRGGFTLVALIHGSPKQEQYERSLTFGIDWNRYNFLKNNSR